MVTQTRQPRHAFPLIWLFFFALLAASLWAWWRFGIRPESELAGVSGRSPFDLSQAPSADPALPPVGEVQARPRTIPGGLPSVVPESRGLPGGKSAEAERKFIREHDGEIRKEQIYLAGIIWKYQKKYPVVQKLQDDVMKLKRVVALTDQYHKDRNMFAWARGVIALPEVKDMVKTYSADPQMWRAGVGMAIEGLRRPPPAAIYTELIKLFTVDPVVSKPFSEMVTTVLTKLPENAMQAITPGANLAPLLALANELNPGGNLMLPPIPGIPNNVRNMNEYWRGYRDGYEMAISQKKGIKTMPTK